MHGRAGRLLGRARLLVHRRRHRRQLLQGRRRRHAARNWGGTTGTLQQLLLLLLLQLLLLLLLMLLLQWPVCGWWDNVVVHLWARSWDLLLPDETALQHGSDNTRLGVEGTRTFRGGGSTQLFSQNGRPDCLFGFPALGSRPLTRRYRCECLRPSAFVGLDSSGHDLPFERDQSTRVAARGNRRPETVLDWLTSVRNESHRYRSRDVFF